MYFPYYIAYMTAGFVITLVVFFWALNQGQFKDQNRARFIPLEADGNTKPVKGLTICPSGNHRAFCPGGYRLGSIGGRCYLCTVQGIIRIKR